MVLHLLRCSQAGRPHRRLGPVLRRVLLPPDVTLVCAQRLASSMSNDAARPSNLVGHTRSSLKRTHAMRVAQLKSAELWVQTELGVPAERIDKLASKFVPMWADLLPQWKNWFCDELHFTRDMAALVVRKGPTLLNSRTEKADAVLAWMKSDAGLGWTQNEVQNVALRAPALFGKRVSPMQELLDWMRSDACTIVKTDDEIKASFWSNPLRLGSSLHGRVRPRHDLAAQLGKKVTLFNICSDPDPTFAERLEIGVDALREFERCGPDYKSGRKRMQQAQNKQWVANTLGVRDEDQLDKVTLRFQVRWPDHYEKWLEYLQAGVADMHEDEARYMLQRRFDLLSIPVETAQRTAQWMFESAPSTRGQLGWTREFIHGLFRRAPMLFGAHPERLQGSCDWFTGPEYCAPFQGDGGVDAEDVRAETVAALMRNPMLLMASIGHRIRPRHALAMRMEQPKRLPPYQLAMLPDSSVCFQLGYNSAAELREGIEAFLEEEAKHAQDTMPE